MKKSSLPWENRNATITTTADSDNHFYSLFKASREYCAEMVKLLGKLTRRVWGERRRRRLWALSIQPKRSVWISATCSSEWNSIFQNFPKRGQPRKVYLNFRKKFSLEVFFPLNFASGIYTIFGWMVRISEIQQFPEFLGTFPENFCTICRYFQIFNSFGWMKSILSLSPAFPPPFPSPNHAQPVRDVPGTLSFLKPLLLLV